MTTVSNVLDSLTVPAELAIPQADGSVRCLACGHRCLVRPGRRGICQVRFNQDGQLRVPWGYVAALHADPIEKKPFNHILPGATALTFGMLGCDFHCGYCFTGDTMVITDRGPISLDELFASSQHREPSDPGIAYPENLQAVTREGNFNRLRAIFRHPYRGPLTVVRPYYLPALKCTPEHRLYATDDPSVPPHLVPAKQLTRNHYLAIPRTYRFTDQQTIDVTKELADRQITHRISWKLQSEEIETILAQSAQGVTSRQIGLSIGKNPSYIRHLRSKVAHGSVNFATTSGYLLENGLVRFPKEHHPGIPQELDLDERLAFLLGLYCAEGCVVRAKDRPNSYSLNFSLSPDESQIADKIRRYFGVVFNAEAHVSTTKSTLVVSTGKVSVALLFKALAGQGARTKKVPQCVFKAPIHIIEAFLAAYIAGDGHRFKNGKITATTVSRELAYGVAWLALRAGHLASMYETAMPTTAEIQGRTVSRAAIQYSIVWYENSSVKRKAIETTDYYLIPVKEISQEEFEGFVYNAEVDQEHNYLAGFFLVSNCQNWLTSQALRDPASDESLSYVRRVSPEQIVETARRYGAQVIASSYNEPLITSEWAVSVFEQAAAAGMKCVYISNGNGTPEVLEYLRPHLSGIKIDLKSMNDKNYRQLGGVLDHVLDTIKRVKEMGLWLEVVTLVVPGFNDSTEELWEAARFLSSVSPDIPWHVTAFHSDYKMSEVANTPAKTLLRAAEIGREAGLNFVYAGNLPGRVDEYENTFCPHCHTTLVRRSGYTIHEVRITSEGKCPGCGTPIPGVWQAI